MQFCHLSVSQCVILIGLTIFRSLVLSDNYYAPLRRPHGTVKWSGPIIVMTDEHNVWVVSCLLASISPELHVQSSPMSVHVNLRMALARFSSGGVAIRYNTSGSTDFVMYAQRKRIGDAKNRILKSDSTGSIIMDLTQQHILKLTHQGQHRLLCCDVNECGRPL